ncbi:MAG: tRNA uridine-5-carboxymethylaminomethyl(34) synthesis enzyme MnmG, partial [Bdellovibrionota bacterium]
EQECKYEGYIERERLLMEQVEAADRVKIPVDFDYSSVGALSSEVLGRLSEVRPVSIGQASRMIGVTPSAVASLVIHLRSHHGQEATIE